MTVQFAVLKHAISWQYGDTMTHNDCTVTILRLPL